MNPGVGGRDDDLSELSSMADERSTEALQPPPSPPAPPVLQSPTPKLELPHTLLAAAPSGSSPGAGDYPGEPRDRSADSTEETPEKKTADKGKDVAPCAWGSWKDRKAVRKIPFHIPTITKPQLQFCIMVNNSNRPFEHVWLERSPDGRRFVHPLEKLHVLDLVDRNFEEGEQMKPLPVEGSPFKLVEVVPELKALASKLQDVNEFAVDLEHNQYRSFQGLTCLMQISTRTEDFVIDTLKLRVHVGPYLREVFKDPSKRKVMHGADRDILWLQRDFGIYVCNLFDTGQASRLMKLERNSLEYLLHHFCGIDANKQYQNADWRLRPLPEEMLKYAREDTHYLLYIYDVMRKRLISESPNECGDDLLIEVYRRSYDVCVQLYEKEIFTDRSYLSIYGLQEAGFNSQQLAIVSGLYEWRDNVAREQDESTGYILPNKALLEIAKQMPLSSSSLRHLLKSKNHYMEHYLDTMTEIIIKAMQNAAAFEHVPEQLKKVRQEVSSSASVQMLEEPTGGSAASTSPEFKTTREFIGEQEKAASKLQQIKSSSTLPYYPLSWGRGRTSPYFVDNVRHQYPEFPHQFFNRQAGITGSELVRMPHRGDNSLSSINVPAPGSNDPGFWVPHPPGYGRLQAEGPLPVSGPSFSFAEFYEPMNETREPRQDQGTHQETDTYFYGKTFDYDAARKQ